MKRSSIVLFFCLLQAVVFANDGIKFEQSKWAEIKAKAAKEHKMIFLDAFASWCGPCKYMEENVYTEEKTASYFNENFINVKIDMEAGEGPELSEEFGVTAYPTFLFFSPEGKLLHKYVGALQAEAFIDLGKDAMRPDKQYFTLKEKAKALDLSDANFSTWAGLADGFEDADKDEIIDKFLATKKDLLINKDIATVLINYSMLKDEDLSMLFKNKARVKLVMDWDDEKLQGELYRLVYSKGVKAYMEKNNSLPAFLDVFRKFDPSSLELARQDINFKIDMIMKKDYAAGMNKLISYLKETRNPVKLQTIALWLFNYSENFDKPSLTKFNTALSSFHLRPMDKGKEYYLYLMQMIAYSKLGDELKATAYALKAYKSPGITKEYKDILEENYNVKGK